MSKVESLYLPELATIEDVRAVTETEKYFRIKLNSGKELGHKPGQFAEISVFGIGEAPISISSSPDLKGSFEMVVRNAGDVTAAIHRLNKGDIIGIRGPFGKYYPIEESIGYDLLFVAGGLGLVPMRSFIHYALNRRNDYGKITIALGSKSPKDRLFVDEVNEWSGRKDITFLETVDRGDDSWNGRTGVITKLFPDVRIDPLKTITTIVGPPIMYRFVILETAKLGIPDSNIYFSLERRMKCGVGKCGHCQINGLYCCTDGPVFQYSKIKDYPEAL